MPLGRSFPSRTANSRTAASLTAAVQEAAARCDASHGEQRTRRPLHTAHSGAAAGRSHQQKQAAAQRKVRSAAAPEEVCTPVSPTSSAGLAVRGTGVTTWATSSASAGARIGLRVTVAPDRAELAAGRQAANAPGARQQQQGPCAPARAAEQRAHRAHRAEGWAGPKPAFPAARGGAVKGY